MPRRLTGIWLVLLVSVIARAQGESVLLQHDRYREKVAVAEALGLDTLPAFRVQMAHYKQVLSTGKQLNETWRSSMQRSERIKVIVITRKLTQHASKEEEFREKRGGIMELWTPEHAKTLLPAVALMLVIGVVLLGAHIGNIEIVALNQFENRQQCAGIVCQPEFHQNHTADAHGVGQIPQLGKMGFCQRQLFFLSHPRQLVFQLQRFILQTAGIEKPLQRQPARLVPGFQFLIGRILLLNMPVRIGDSLSFQPLPGLLTSGAGRILNQ